MSIYERSGHAGEGGVPAGRVPGMGTTGTNSDAPEASFEPPSFEFRPDQLEAYRGTGHELIPLHAPNSNDARGRKIGKAPYKGWPTVEPLTVDEAIARMGSGENVGVRLRSTDLVIDVDPRNFQAADNPVSRLQSDLGIRLSDFPEVVTGSGGKHFYMSMPAGLSVCETLVEYPGIEFKVRGRQVVAAGSVHPDTLKPYLWDDFAEPLATAGAAPDALLDLIRRPESPKLVHPGDVTPDQLAQMLEGLDPANFREQAGWFELMCACHHATGGDGRDEFVSWSISDPNYADHGAIVARRWDSLHADGNGRRVTVRSLYKRLADAGRNDLIPRACAEDDFPDDLPDGSISNNAPRREGLADEWVYVIDAEVFVRRCDGKKWSKEQWKAAHADRFDGDIVSAVFRGKLPVRKFEALVYLPGAAEFPDGERGRYNIWRDSGVEARPGDVGPFLGHLANLVPDEAERGHLLDYLAMIVQEPGRKIHFALLLRGGQGTGKSWLGRLMTSVIGAPNVVFPSNDEVLSQWTIWTEGSCFAVIEELMARGRLDMANRLKPIITEPTLRIEEKKRSIYTIPNHLNLMAFTNHEDAMPIENGDRRWLVISSPLKPMGEGYYQRLFAFLDGDGPSAVKHFLLSRKVSLNPKGMAPNTKGKAEMRRRSLSEAEQYLAELLEGREGPFAFDLVRLDDLVAWVPADLKRHTRNVRGKVSDWLRDEVGAMKHTRYTKADVEDRTSSILWSVRNHDHWDAVGAAARADAFGRRYAEASPADE